MLDKTLFSNYIYAVAESQGVLCAAICPRKNLKASVSFFPCDGKDLCSKLETMLDLSIKTT